MIISAELESTPSIVTVDDSPAAACAIFDAGRAWRPTEEPTFAVTLGMRRPSRVADGNDQSSPFGGCPGRGRRRSLLPWRVSGWRSSRPGRLTGVTLPASSGDRDCPQPLLAKERTVGS
ncbi:hypothetical protein GCM10027062_31470 [Nocardioides hungaricus]